MSLIFEFPLKRRSCWVVLTVILIISLEKQYVKGNPERHSVLAMRERESDWKLERECIPPDGCQNDTELRSFQLNVTVLLPFDPYYKASLSRVGQAIFLGFENVRDMGLLPEYNFSLHYQNSACSNMYAPYKFMEDVFNHRVDVFFGPSCELALAPVARWLKFVDKPLLTAGGLTFDYTEPKTDFDSEYFLTTRTGFSFKDMVEFIMTYFDRFNWRKAFLMYDKEDMRDVSGMYTCKFFMETVAEYLKENKWPFGNFDVKTNNVNASVKEILAKELGLKYSAKVNVTPVPMYLEDRREIRLDDNEKKKDHLPISALAYLCLLSKHVKQRVLESDGCAAQNENCTKIINIDKPTKKKTICRKKTKFVLIKSLIYRLFSYLLAFKLALK